MPYIYKITNKINNKLYIGKTMLSIEKRWKEHLRDYNKESKAKRPLYSAIKKYGIENFIIEQLEECEPEKLNEREIYWIEFYNSFKYGYNATMGGDGKAYLDYDLIIKLYNELQNIAEVSRRTGASPDGIRNVLKSKNIQILSSKEISKKINSKPIQSFSLNGDFIALYSSASEAARYLINNNLAVGSTKGVSCRLGHVANGKRKTAYKMKWEWVI